MIIKEWPISGEVFDLPTSTLYISAGMTEQPLQLQYMIMRRANEMWRLGQFEYRKKPVYKYNIDQDTSRFLVLHSKYIDIFLIYELCLILADVSILRISKLFGYDLLLPASTIDKAINGAKEKIAEGKSYTVIEFAKKFNFPEELAIKLLDQIDSVNSVKEEKIIQDGDNGLGIVRRFLNSADRNRRILIQGMHGFGTTIKEALSFKKSMSNI
jgi:hypothetical protein